MKVRYVLSALAVCLFAIQAQAGIIKSVTAISSSVTPTVEPLVEKVNVYHDRSPGHRLVNLPPEFFGGTGPSAVDPQVIVTSNSDKTRADFQLEVTTDRLGILYVALDTRHRDNQPLAWMQNPAMTGLPTVFFDTGRTVDIDEGSTFENAGESVDQTFNLWATIAPAGTYNFFEQTYGGGSNNYVILADNKLITIPEPASIALLLMGLVGIVAKARRK